MIARIIIPILLLLLISDVYVDRRMLHRLKRRRFVWRMLWWAQCGVMVVYSVVVAMARNFAPDSMLFFSSYLMLLSAWGLPKFVFVVCSILGWGHCAYHKTRVNWGNTVGALLAVVLSACSIYSMTAGFDKVRVRHVVYRSSSLPKAFDGYRIVQFSDLHVGTYVGGKAHIVGDVVDSIMSQRPDMIVFTGDLQNMQPSELLPHERQLSRLKAKDGVFSVLGNHDYAYYIKGSDSDRLRCCRQMIREQRQMGWQLLLNENRIVRRGKDSIVVAGMEYEGQSVRVPSRGNLRHTLLGVNQKSAFVLMLQHDPTSWRTDILPHSSAQLTLSGHTHGGQVNIFGWSPAAFAYSEWGGMYTSEDGRAINVSSGVGGFAPFRLGCPGEVVVIELRRK